MIKRVAVILTAIFCLFLGTVVSAEEAPSPIVEAHYYSGLLYYCDAEDGVVVLKNVDVVGTVNQTNTKTAVESEYVEIPIVGPAIFKDGSTISLADCNVFADSNVHVLITRNAQGALRVMQLRFL